MEIDENRKSVNRNAVIHVDLSNSSMKKDYAAFCRAYLKWCADNIIVDHDTDILISFSTGLIAQNNDVSPDKSEDVGRQIQTSLDHLSFEDKLSSFLKLSFISEKYRQSE